MRITAGTNAWRKVVERHISRKLKGNVRSSGIYERTRDNGTNKYTIEEGPGLQKQSGDKNYNSLRSR